MLASGWTLVVRSGFAAWLVWTRLCWPPDACIWLDAGSAFRLPVQVNLLIHRQDAEGACLAVPRCLHLLDAVGAFWLFAWLVLTRVPGACVWLDTGAAFCLLAQVSWMILWQGCTAHVCWSPGACIWLDAGMHPNFPCRWCGHTLGSWHLAHNYIIMETCTKALSGHPTRCLYLA